MADENSTPTVIEPAPVKAKVKKKAAKKKSIKKKAKKKSTSAAGAGKSIIFPKHSILKALRMPQAVLENNAGRDCTDREAAAFAGIGWGGPVAVEISSALKY